MARLKDLTLRCMPCGQMGRDPDLFGECVCGANNWEETAPQPPPPPRPTQPHLRLVPDRPSGAPDAPGPPPPHPPPSDGFVDGADVPNAIVDDFVGARLNELLGGIMRGARILIAGRAGAGKSTATADLAAVAAEHWSRPEAGRMRVPSCPIYWLDADQKDSKLVRKLFVTAKAEHVIAERRRVRLLQPRREPYTYQEALAMVPPDARVLVMDSLESWGRGGYARQLEVMLAFGDHPAWLKVMIAGTNNRGGVAGLGDVPRADDATVYAVRSDEGQFLLHFDKRRWDSCDAARARGAGNIGLPPPAPQPAPPPAAPAAPPLPAPDFSREFIALAAGWGVRELEGYKAHLRAQQVPRDSIEGWLAAIREARGPEVDGDADEPPDLPPTLH